VEGRGSQATELLERKMKGTSSPENVSTKLQRIAKLAKEAPDMVFTTLAHHIDLELLDEAFRLTRKDGATGIDGQGWIGYAANLQENLRSLLDRFKSGTYQAPPVRRVHIPKGDGKSTRPIGIPTFEDKVLQRAVMMVLEAVYEQDFLDCSYGFRPGRSAHQALATLWQGLMNMGGGWVVEVDIKSYFDTVDHGHLRSFLDRRVRDGVLRRALDKWLKAGVLEDGNVHHPEGGTPQGGVVSPLLANIYLHEVLDRWLAREVKPRLRSQAFMVRYADDVAIVVGNENDARRVLDVLGKRFAKYGLALHPEKTRMLDFRRPRGSQSPANPSAPETFDILGFTWYWGKSRKGAAVIQRKTSSSRFRRALSRIADWCRTHRHDAVAAQHIDLSRKLRGHYAYFGITGNARCLSRFLHEVERVWRYWLNRRSARARMVWERFCALLQRYPLPPIRIVHSIYRPATKP
jgi:group II intron reverse transcriptase/maturase